MAGPFDATTKHLVEAHPDDWLRLAGLKGVTAEAIDADLSTVTAEADKVLRVAADPPWLMHLELQAGYLPDLPRRTQVHNALLDRRHDLPVRSVIILLRPEADGPAMTGEYV
ncbi:MAG TPA: hypothetical protein VGS41_07915, partial [Chthonomonadales bacterium]|nr:hypothetical protein [Chthonomonadales bacterium]